MHLICQCSPNFQVWLLSWAENLNLGLQNGLIAKVGKRVKIPALLLGFFSSKPNYDRALVS